ncbi:hypothetical protein COBT_000691 [Conglomerata obtusa]
MHKNSLYDAEILFTELKLKKLILGRNFIEENRNILIEILEGKQKEDLAYIWKHAINIINTKNNDSCNAKELEIKINLKIFFQTRLMKQHFVTSTSIK